MSRRSLSGETERREALSSGREKQVERLSSKHSEARYTGKRNHGQPVTLGHAEQVRVQGKMRPRGQWQPGHAGPYRKGDYSSWLTLVDLQSIFSQQMSWFE